jgi:hypothetical protein
MTIAALILVGYSAWFSHYGTVAKDMDVHIAAWAFDLASLACALASLAFAIR